MSMLADVLALTKFFNCVYLKFKYFVSKIHKMCSINLICGVEK